MGYRGKTVQQQRARELRSRGWTYAEIHAELDVSRSSVSLWVRDVEVDHALLDARRRARWVAGDHSVTERPSSPRARKEDEIEQCAARARTWVGALSERDLFVAGIALYAGEGFKTGGAVGFATPIPGWWRCSSGGSGRSSRWTSPVCGCGSTCTSTSTSTPPIASGPR